MLTESKSVNLDHAMEGAVLVMQRHLCAHPSALLACAESAKILSSLGNNIVEKLKDDATHCAV